MDNLFNILIILALFFMFTGSRPVEPAVHFCPEDNCSLQVVSAVNSAERTIRIAVYSFTLGDIAEALVKAEQRGASVKVLVDYVQSFNGHCKDEFLERNGIEVVRRKARGLMHNKFMIIDKKLVITGSFNYSKSGNSKNDENLVFIYNESVAVQYLDEFYEMVLESEGYA